MHRQYQITAVCLTLLLVQIQAENEEGCRLTNDQLSKRNIKNIDKEIPLAIDEFSLLTCQSGYGLFMLPSKTEIKFSWPTIETVPNKLITKCNGHKGKKGDLVFKYQSSDCNDDICDGFCKKYYTKKEMLTNMNKMHIKFQLPSNRDLFWPGDVFTQAVCEEDYFREKYNNTASLEGKHTYAFGSHFKIELNVCVHIDNCAPSFEDEFWVPKYKCVKPTCDTVYAQNRLNMNFENVNEASTYNKIHKYRCKDTFTLDKKRTEGELECVFDKTRRITFWRDIDSKFQDLQCDKYCSINSEEMKNALSNFNYQLAHKENRSEVRLKHTFWVECVPDYIHEGDTEDEIIQPFEVTWQDGTDFQQTHICQDGNCNLPPNEHLFHVKGKTSTGEADCLDGYTNKANNNTNIFLICYNNQWKAAKMNGATMECAIIKKDCLVDWRNNGIEFDGKKMQHGETANLKCYTGFEVVNSGKDKLNNVKCIDGVLMKNNKEARCHPRKCKNGYPKNRNIIEKRMGEASTSEYKCQTGYSNPNTSENVVWMFCVDGIDKWEGECIPTKCPEKPDASTFGLSESWPPTPSDINFGGNTSHLTKYNFNENMTTGMFCCRQSYGRNNSDNRFDKYLHDLGLGHLLPFYNFNRRCIMLKCVNNDWFKNDEDDVCVDETSSTGAYCNLRESNKNNALRITLNGQEKQETSLTCKDGFSPPLDGKVFCHANTQLYHTSQCMTNNKKLTECISPGCQPNVCDNDPPDNENIHMHRRQVAQSGFFQCKEGYLPIIAHGKTNAGSNEYKNHTYGLCHSNGTWTFQNNCYKTCEIKADGKYIQKSIPLTAENGNVTVNSSYCNEGFHPYGLNTDDKVEYICIDGKFTLNGTKIKSKDLCVPNKCSNITQSNLNVLDNDKYGSYKCIKDYATIEGTKLFDTIEIKCNFKGEWPDKDKCFKLCPSIPNGTIIGETFDSKHKTEYREGFSGMLQCNPQDDYCKYNIKNLDKPIAKVFCKNGKFQTSEIEETACACNRVNTECTGEPDPSVFHTVEVADNGSNSSPRRWQCDHNADYYPINHTLKYIHFKCVKSQWKLRDPASEECVKSCKPFSNDSTTSMIKLGSNLYQNDLDSKFYHGTHINVTCQPGYSIQTQQNVVILCDNGSWLMNGKPITNPCQKNICIDYPSGDEFHVTRDSKQTGYFFCYEEYAPSYDKKSNSIILLCHLNKWSLASQDDKCYRECKSGSDVSVVNDDFVRHGQLVNVKCRLYEMELVGGPLARCHDGILMHVNDENQPMVYDKEVKVCKPVPCNDPNNCHIDGQDDNTPTERNDKSFFDNDWAIPVIVICSILLLMLIGLLVFIIYRRRRDKNMSLDDDDDRSTENALSIKVNADDEKSSGTMQSHSLSQRQPGKGLISHNVKPTKAQNASLADMPSYVSATKD